MKNSGGFKVRNNVIYVFGTINKKRYRFSTNKSATSENLRWIARNYWSVLLQKIDEKEKTKEPKISVDAFLLEMLELSKRKRSQITQNEYISKTKRLIAPYFGKFDMADIKPIDIEKWQNELLGKYSTVTVRRAKTLLNFALAKAALNGIIPKNPCASVDNFRVVINKKEPYTIDEMSKILRSATGWFGVFLHVAFATGLRTGELIALKWEDIDLERNIIFVRRAIVRGEVSTGGATKNHDRIAVIPEYLADMLGGYDSKSEWLFPTKKGEPFKEGGSLTRMYFKPLLERIGVKYKTLYATRHTFVSILRNSGVNKEFVAELAGHSSQISDKHYYKAEITPEKIRSINNVFFNLNLEDKAQIKAQ
nr:MAG TPA: Integrase [Caudoviricetes sp.]